MCAVAPGNGFALPARMQALETTRLFHLEKTEVEYPGVAVQKHPLSSASGQRAPEIALRLSCTHPCICRGAAVVLFVS